MSDIPEEPLSLTTQNAVTVHEYFKSYVAAGFTETQALAIIIAIITNRPCP